MGANKEQEMNLYSQNTETHEHSHSQESRGVVRVQFTDQYNPISNLGYRFRLPNGELEEGITDGEGYTKTLICDTKAQPNNSELICYVQLNSTTAPVTLEVKRDDGTWKNIGSFELEKEVEKNVFARISTTKLPFKLALVKG